MRQLWVVERYFIDHTALMNTHDNRAQPPASLSDFYCTSEKNDPNTS